MKGEKTWEGGCLHMSKNDLEENGEEKLNIFQ